jgi:hypothetical protein
MAHQFQVMHHMTIIWAKDPYWADRTDQIYVTAMLIGEYASPFCNLEFYTTSPGLALKSELWTGKVFYFDVVGPFVGGYDVATNRMLPCVPNVLDSFMIWEVAVAAKCESQSCAVGFPVFWGR